MFDYDNMTTPFGFAGGLYEGSNGLVRFGPRDYESAIGRWVSKFPIRFSGEQSNIYAHVGNDPINNVGANGKIDLFVCLQLVQVGDVAGLAACLAAPDNPYRTNFVLDDCEK